MYNTRLRSDQENLPVSNQPNPQPLWPNWGWSGLAPGLLLGGNGRM